MNSWLPSARDRFTPADLALVHRLLCPRLPSSSWISLVSDPPSWQRLLDDRRILDHLVDAASPLTVSPPFYFYILVRHAFLQAGLDDPGLADYVAGAIAQRLRPDDEDPLRSLPDGMTRTADVIASLAATRGRLRFYLQIEAGNQFLVLTGLFPGWIHRRARRYGAPDVPYYENFARRILREAADNRHAPGDTPRDLLVRISDQFPLARRSLNLLGEQRMFLGN